MLSCFFGFSAYLTENQNVTNSFTNSYIRGLAFLFKILPCSPFSNIAPPPLILCYTSRVLEVETLSVSNRIINFGMILDVQTFVPA